MNTDYANKVLELLEKISANQELQIKRQQESLDIQKAQIEKSAGFITRAENIQKSGRKLVYILFAVALIAIIGILLL